MRSLMPILLITVSLALFYVFIDPRLEVVRDLVEEENQYQEAILKAEELMVVRDQLLSQYNSIPDSDLNRLERIVPDSVNFVKLVADIDSIGGNHGIVPKGINIAEVLDQSLGIGDPASLKPYLSSTISFSFISSYEDLVSFLTDLEKSLQMIDIKSITFSAEGENRGLYTFNVSFDTYWLR